MLVQPSCILCDCVKGKCAHVRSELWYPEFRMTVYRQTSTFFQFSRSVFLVQSNAPEKKISFQYADGFLRFSSWRSVLDSSTVKISYVVAKIKTVSLLRCVFGFELLFVFSCLAYCKSILVSVLDKHCENHVLLIVKCQQFELLQAMHENWCVSGTSWCRAA